MNQPPSSELDPAALEAVAGYLNFSDGSSDPRFLAALDRLARGLPTDPQGRFDGRGLEGILRGGIVDLSRRSGPFREVSQALGVIDRVFGDVLPGYLDFHRDLLFHQRPETLFNAFFVARACEATLRVGGPWEDRERITDAALKRLSDYVGHRPLAVLEQRRLIVDPHEKVRPVPLYVASAGTTAGPYEPVVRRALELLRDTDEELLAVAQFDLQRLDELAFDPRAYDFDHPANRRPNYHFGIWDPDLIDNQGHYRRFVIQQVTLDALHLRLNVAGDLPRNELEYEAAAVLAGTILMASGISGSGPGAIDSETNLGQLLARVARFRDEFYERLLQRLAGPHGDRLRKEARVRRQPFGAARQHINGALARQRASQLEHVHLAKVFARMGYLTDAVREANVVPVASARMSCLIDCALASAQVAIQDRRWQEGRQRIVEAIETVRRAIGCGALVDPWNVLGFDAHFPLFSGPENSVHDHRADELIAIVDRIFAVCSKFWNEAATADSKEDVAWVAETYGQLAEWWHRFAIHEVSSVEASDPLQTFGAARHVADCLSLWRRSGAASGDVGFWAGHAARFDSPNAYALVVDALLERHDFVAARGLLMHWLGQAEQGPLDAGPTTFFDLSYRWMLAQLHGEGGRAIESPRARLATWGQATRWFDHLEANADSYWHVPRFEPDGVGRGAKPTPPQADQLAGTEDDESDDGKLFGAAYEDVVYRDSTDDGIESSLFETGSIGPEGLEREAKRIGRRIAFIAHVAKLWKVAGLLADIAIPRHRSEEAEADVERIPDNAASDVVETLDGWARQADAFRRGLDALLRQVQQHPLAGPTADHEALVEYDRRRLVKENLIDAIIGVTIEVEEACRTLSAMRLALGAVEETSANGSGEFVEVLAAVLLRDRALVRERFDRLADRLASEPLLYVPLAKGGDPHRIVVSRVRRTAIQELLVCLPRLGLLEETHRLLEVAREMEQSNPVGQGAVTEFDELFRIGYRAMVDSIIEWSRTWPEIRESPDGDETWDRDDRLYLAIDRLAECSLVTWFEHSETLRLSVLEKVRDPVAWERLVDFVKKYGGDLFTQRFFNLANLRAILHQGVARWLEQLVDQRTETRPRLLEALEHEIRRDDAERCLTLVLEAIIENYAEYRDYNSTTTQSDRGELLYMLLDFLRLRVRYDRVAWRLKPVVWSHEVLVRRGCESVARRWRRRLRQRIGSEPDRYLQRFQQLQTKYAMQMSSIRDRIQEKFVMPLRIDRLRAFVETAIRHPGTFEAERAFDGLRLETRLLTTEPTGSGLEVPRWLAALEDEVERTATRKGWEIDLREALVPVLEPLGEAELFEQLLRLQRELDEDRVSVEDPLESDD